ncbi:MAG: glucosylceramidase [Candidatus Margulisbacteria bacterium]|nr:glucosylceramidase [Candidatus Margulisiibacteriota bacterium]
MKKIPTGIFSIGIGKANKIKAGKEKTERVVKGFLGLPKKIKIKMMDTYPHGAPVGGFGAGTIGRTPDGDFSVWHLATGRHVYENIPACQFHVYQKIGKKKVAQSLSANKPKWWQLSSFKWKYPKGQGKYSALYPKSFFEYNAENWPMKLSCTQFSPILPNNYQETSYPIAVYIWRGKNETKEPIKLSLMLTWENVIGWDVTWPKAVHNSEQCFWIKKPGETVHQVVENKYSVSLILSRRKKIEQFCFAMPKNKKYLISYQKDFNPRGSGSVVWKSFSKNGQLKNKEINPEGKRNAAALAVKTVVLPGEEMEIPFIMSWDYPKHEFKDGKYFYRYYTNYFGKHGRGSLKIARDGLRNYLKWEKEIDKWHLSYLKKYESWFVSFLFNELYYLADGGTVWDAKTGDFGLLECYDYFFYETLDVRFYASFPLLKFWPRLEKKIMSLFAAAILKEDNTFTRFWEYNWKTDIPITEEPRQVYSGPIKVKGACPHDLGSLSDFPLRRMNSYIWRNPNYWKDINAKFVLLIYRDYILGDKNKKFLKDSWAAVKEALYFLKKMDKDDDGLIENEGFPDQTYDNWPMSGVSAYCGGLWLAALQTAIQMGKLLQKTKEVKDFQRWLQSGKKIFHQKLWNGQYYNCYEGCTDIFSDQLVGQWYTQLVQLDALLPNKNIKSSLESIFKNNVLTFGNGQIGAVNGRKADGSHCGHEQGDDAWIGTNCFLAGLMLSNGLKKEGWQILKGVYDLIYNKKGYYFRTPEGYRENGDYVGTMYMRPMAVWSVIS